MGDFLLKLISLAIVSAMFLSAGMWIALFIRLFNRQPILKLMPRTRSPWDHVEVLITIGLLMISSKLTTDLLQFFGYVNLRIESPAEMPVSQQAILMLTGSLIQLVIAVGLIAWITSRSQSPRTDFGLQQPIAKLVGIGVIGALMIIPPVTIIQALLTQLISYKHDLLEMINDQPSMMFYAVAGITGVVVAPFAEEIFFRMLFQGWLESVNGKKFGSHDALDSFADPMTKNYNIAGVEVIDNVGENPYQPSFVTGSSSSEPSATVRDDSIRPPWWPILASAFMFGLAHVGQGPAPVTLFFFSLGLGYLYRQTHSVIPCITVHFILNAMTLSVVMLSGAG